MIQKIHPNLNREFLTYFTKYSLESGSWKAGGSCAISKNERNEPNVSQHVHIVQSHLSANSVERQVFIILLLRIFFHSISNIF